MSEREEQQGTRAKKPRLNLTTSQVAASALAACCASIVASYLGVAGTVIGAAVGSVVATTGAAVWGHVFRTGGDKIKQTLLVNGQFIAVEQDPADEGPPADQPAQAPTVLAGRFYGADERAGADGADAAAASLWTPKEATAETKLILPPGADAGSDTRLLAPSDGPGRPSRGARILKYGKPMGIAAAVIAVFAISIVVGMFAGAPVRSAGSSNAPATTQTTTVAPSTGGMGSNGPSAPATSTASKSAGATPSPSATSSNSATSSSSAGPTASPSGSTSAKSSAPASGSPRAQGATATATGSP